MVLAVAKQDVEREANTSRELRERLALGITSESVESKDPFSDTERDDQDHDGGESKHWDTDWDGETTVEGTLASIQEQVRQLEEMNQMIGSEAGRWKIGMSAA